MFEWQFVFGKLDLELTSGDSAALLNACKEINLQNVVYRDDLTLRVTVSRLKYNKLLQIAEKQGAAVKVIRSYCLYRTGVSLARRPILLLFATLLFAMAAFLPSRILFVSVDGNQSIPTNKILEAAAECGIRFGATRRQVRSEKIKNTLLQKIPDLQWAGVNTSGCTALISVREKTTQETRKEANNYVSSIVASRDGIIQNCTVYQGNPLCAVGQAVKKGQTLVSGYQDCGIVIKGTRANAEIKALTFRELVLISPNPTMIRGEKRIEKTCFSIRIGKKLIKFYKDSGNLDTTCGKIYLEEYVQLPGGFALPIAIVRESYFNYSEAQQVQATQDNEDWLPDFAISYLENTMVAGEIISAQSRIVPAEGGCLLNGKYACTEIIGQIKYEQIIEKGD